MGFIPRDQPQCCFCEIIISHFVENASWHFPTFCDQTMENKIIHISPLSALTLFLGRRCLNNDIMKAIGSLPT